MKLLCDIHTHTIFSRHAYSTIEENVRAAAEAGLEVLGSADHFGNMLFSDNDVRQWQFFYNLGCWPREWHGVTLLRAAEADICSLNGDLYGEDVVYKKSMIGQPYKEEQTLYTLVTRDLDYLVASIHNKTFTDDAPISATTQMYINALEHKRVLMIGHPGRAGVPFDIDEVLTVAKEKNKLIEINEHSFGMGPHAEVCKKIAIRCAELGVHIGVSTDAHISHDIGRFPTATSMLEEIHFPEELIATRSRDALFEQMRAAHVSKLKGLN